VIFRILITTGKTVIADPLFHSGAACISPFVKLVCVLWVKESAEYRAPRRSAFCKRLPAFNTAAAPGI